MWNIRQVAQRHRARIPLLATKVKYFETKTAQSALLIHRNDLCHLHKAMVATRVLRSENAGYLYNSNEDYGDNVHDPEENQHALIWRRNVARRRDWQFGTVK